ncbi:MAG: hypothetical protein ACF8Q5_14380 [Phycisphaerales bacterium JB040]
MALAMILWALLRDRPCGRARCPRCWYSLDGALKRDAEPERSEGSDMAFECVCPECGRTITNRRHLFRTHRRWGAAWMGMALLVVGLAAGVLPRARAHGVVSLLPTTVLLECDSYTWEAGEAHWFRRWTAGGWLGAVDDELSRREGYTGGGVSRSLAPWQWRRWLRTSGALDPSPGAVAWHDPAPEFLEHTGIDPESAGYGRIRFVWGHGFRIRVVFDSEAVWTSEQLSLAEREYFAEQHDPAHYRMARDEGWFDPDPNEERSFTLIGASRAGGTSGPHFPTVFFVGGVPDRVRVHAVVEFGGDDADDLELGWFEVPVRVSGSE